jgi:hypothetical protein
LTVSSCAAMLWIPMAALAFTRAPDDSPREHPNARAKQTTTRMSEDDRRIRLSLNAVSGEKWFREGKNHFKCAFWRPGPKSQTKLIPKRCTYCCQL